MTKAHTTAYLSGAICGPIWWPVGELCGRPLRVDLHSCMRRFSTPATFADAVRSIAMEEGGDFQSASFTADTVIRIERRTPLAGGAYRVNVWERELLQLPACADWVNADAYAADFMGGE